jgi:hypothetical protein
MTTVWNKRYLIELRHELIPYLRTRNRLFNLIKNWPDSVRNLVVVLYLIDIEDSESDIDKYIIKGEGIEVIDYYKILDDLKIPQSEKGIYND